MANAKTCDICNTIVLREMIKVRVHVNGRPLLATLIVEDDGQQPTVRLDVCETCTRKIIGGS